MRATGRTARLLLSIVVVLAASGCGGGGGNDGGVVGPQSASFAAADPTPPADSISLQQGTRAGLVVNVLVSVTDVPDFFGAGLRLTYDPSIVRFESSSSTGSFLRDAPFDGPGAGLQFLVDSSTPGVLNVAATRQQNPAGNAPGVDVNGTRTLISLQFRLLLGTAGTPATMPAQQREARDSQGNPLALTWHAGSFLAN